MHEEAAFDWPARNAPRRGSPFSMTGTTTSDTDVIVVGGGHNGLIAAAYLARAGVETVLVEARSTVGGCASTVSDLDARFNICNCDHTMIRAMPVIDELDLAAHGLRYVEPEITSIHRFHDRSNPWFFYHEVERTLDSIASAYPGQVNAYRRYLADALPVAELVIAIARTPAHTRDMLTTVARRRGAGAQRLLHWSRRSAHDVLSEYFDDWRLRMPAISNGPTVWGVPPETPGTGLAAALYATRHLIKTGRPVGGSGALTDAILASFVAAGGTVRCDAPVERLMTTGDRVTGVVLKSGEQLRARKVLAAYDAQRVMTTWLDRSRGTATSSEIDKSEIDKEVASWRAQPVPDGYESKLDAVTIGVPVWRDAPTTLPGAIGAVGEPRPEVEAGAKVEAVTEVAGPTTTISPSPDQLAAAHRLRREGRVSPTPTMLVNSPSVLDPTMHSTPGEHILSVEVLFTPYELVDGWPGSSEPQRWLDLVAGFVEPGSLIVDRWRAMTPDRYEAEFGMHRGHTPAFAAPPMVAFLGRQRSMTRYQSPIEGLYFTGASTFPGAGIFGAAGRNAAHAIIDTQHPR